jgi:hypothetical protein
MAAICNEKCVKILRDTWDYYGMRYNDLSFVKLNLSLCLIKQKTVKAYAREEVRLYVFWRFSFIYFSLPLLLAPFTSHSLYPRGNHWKVSSSVWKFWRRRNFLKTAANLTPHPRVLPINLSLWCIGCCLFLRFCNLSIVYCGIWWKEFSNTR